MHRNALRLQKLVNSLLEFSRIEAGRIQANYEPTDLARFTEELASTFRSGMERAGLILTVDCAPLPQAVYVDCDMWEKIVLNLLSNALKFTFRRRCQCCGQGGWPVCPVEGSGYRYGHTRIRVDRTFSSAFTASREPGAAASKAPASDSRWCRSWSTCTGARSPSKAKFPGEPALQSGSVRYRALASGQDGDSGNAAVGHARSRRVRGGSAALAVRRLTRRSLSRARHCRPPGRLARRTSPFGRRQRRYERVREAPARRARIM